MKGQNGEASDYVLHGDALKKIVRKGRKRPMPFAFVPDYGDDESMFAVHKKRKPEIVARATRLASGQSRVAWGTFTVIGRVMVLTCIVELPGIAKKLKRHMRMEKLRVDIRVLDQSGRELEADLDAGDDDEDPLGPDDDDDDDAPAPRKRNKDREDPEAVRIAAIRPAIMAATGIPGDRLRDLLSALDQARADGRPEKAMLLAKLEEQTRALMNSSRRPRIAAAPRRTADRGTAAADRPAKRPVPAPADAVPADAVPADPRALRSESLRIARGIAVLRRRIEALDDADIAGRLLAALAIAARTVRSGELGAGAEAARRVADALQRVEATQAAARDRDADAADP